MLTPFHFGPAARLHVRDKSDDPRQSGEGGRKLFLVFFVCPCITKKQLPLPVLEGQGQGFVSRASLLSVATCLEIVLWGSSNLQSSLLMNTKHESAAAVRPTHT